MSSILRLIALVFAFMLLSAGPQARAEDELIPDRCPEPCEVGGRYVSEDYQRLTVPFLIRNGESGNYLRISGRSVSVAPLVENDDSFLWILLPGPDLRFSDGKISAITDGSGFEERAYKLVNLKNSMALMSSPGLAAIFRNGVPVHSAATHLGDKEFWLFRKDPAAGDSARYLIYHPRVGISQPQYMYEPGARGNISPADASAKTMPALVQGRGQGGVYVQPGADFAAAGFTWQFEEAASPRDLARLTIKSVKAIKVSTGMDENTDILLKSVKYGIQYGPMVVSLGQTAVAQKAAKGVAAGAKAGAKAAGQGVIAGGKAASQGAKSFGAGLANWWKNRGKNEIADEVVKESLKRRLINGTMTIAAAPFRGLSWLTKTTAKGAASGSKKFVKLGAAAARGAPRVARAGYVKAAAGVAKGKRFVVGYAKKNPEKIKKRILQASFKQTYKRVIRPLMSDVVEDSGQPGAESPAEAQERKILESKLRWSGNRNLVLSDARDATYADEIEVSARNYEVCQETKDYAVPQRNPPYFRIASTQNIKAIAEEAKTLSDTMEGQDGGAVAAKVGMVALDLLMFDVSPILDEITKAAAKVDDQLTIKIGGARVWPNGGPSGDKGWRTIGSGQTKEVGVEYIFRRGDDVRIDLEEYDSGSSNDSLGSLTISTNHLYDIEEYEGAYIQETSEGSLYEVNFIVEPLYVPTPSEVERKKLHDVECAPVIRQAKAESFAREVELVRLDGRMELLRKYGEEALHQYDRTVEWADFNACPSSQNYYDILVGEWRVGRYDKDGNQDRNVTWTNTFKPGGSTGGEIITPSQDGKWSRTSLAPGRHVQKFGKDPLGNSNPKWTWQPFEDGEWAERKHSVDTCEIYAAMYDKDGLPGGRGREIFPYGRDDRNTGYFEIGRELSFAIRGDVSGGAFKGVVNQIADKSSDEFRNVNYLQDYYRDQAVPASQDGVDSNLYLTASGPAEFWLEKISDTPVGQRADGSSSESRWIIEKVKKTIAGSWQIAPFKQGTEYPQQADPAIKKIWTFTTDGIFIEKPENDFWFNPPMSGTWKYIGDQRIEVTTNRPVRIPVDPEAPKDEKAGESELGKTFIVKMAQELGDPTQFTGFFVQDRRTGAKVIWSKPLHPGKSPYEMPELYSDAFFELLESKSKASGVTQASLAKRRADTEARKAKRQTALAQLLGLKSKSPCNMDYIEGPGRTAFQGKWRVGQYDLSGGKKYAWNYKKMSSPYSEREQKREPRITSWRPDDVRLAENERDAFVWETDYLTARQYEQEWEFPADGKISVRTRLGNDVGYKSRSKKGEEAYPTARFDWVQYNSDKRAFVMITDSNWVQLRDREDFELAWQDQGCAATVITLPDSEGGTRDYRANFIYHENGDKEFYLTHPDGSLYLWGQQDADQTKYSHYFDNKILTPEQVAAECRLDMPSSTTRGQFPYSYVDENIRSGLFMLWNEGLTPVRVYRESAPYWDPGNFKPYHSHNLEPGGYREFKANPTEKVAFLDASKIIKFDNKEGIRYIDRFKACIGSKRVDLNQFTQIPDFVFGKGYVHTTKQTDVLTTRLNCFEYTPADRYPGRHAVVNFENQGSIPLEIWRLNDTGKKISPTGKTRDSSPGDDSWDDANRYKGIEPIVTLEPGDTHELRTRVGYAFTAIRPGTQRMGQEYREETGRVENVVQGKAEECFGEIRISEASESVAFSDELSQKDARDLSDKRKKDREEEKRILNNLGLVSDIDPAPDTVSESAKAGTPVGVTAFAADGDAGDIVSYSVSHPFKIDAKTGIVMVNTPLDREAAASHTFTVTATSGGGAISTKEFVVAVEDVNEFDVSPVATYSEKWVKKSETSRNYQQVTLDDNHEVSEGAAVGRKVVLTAVAEDKDATNNTVRYSLSDNAGGLFAIDPTTGEVKTARPLDYEKVERHSIVVVATSADGSSSSRKTSIAVLNANDADVGPVTDADPAPNAVLEGVPTGTPVGITVQAMDEDTGDTITYKRQQCSGCTNYYNINPVSGVVTTSSWFDQIDLETVWSDPYARGRIAEAGRLRVVAESSDGSTSEQEFTIDILDAEEFQIGRTYDDDDALDQVAENAAIGTPVGVTAKAIDQDAKSTVSYKLTDNSGGRFRIDPVTGIITVAGQFDAESAQSHAVRVVSTSNDGSTSARDIEIRISDVNEFRIGQVVDIDKAPDTVVEASGMSGIQVIHLAPVGITAQARDPDASSIVRYSLKGGHPMDRRTFGRDGQSYIDQHISIDMQTGVVSAWGEGVNFEATPTLTFTVIATSDDGSSSEAEFTLNVVNVNERVVQDLKDSDPASDEVPENSPVGTPVGITALATDGDTSDRISYGLKDSSGGLFAINPVSGIVIVAANLDAEKAERHYLTVVAASSDGSMIEQNFLVIVRNVNEFAVGEVRDSDSASDRVDENAAFGTPAGVLADARDDDRGDSVSFALASDASGRFAIDPVSGRVTVAGPIGEASPSHVIEVIASSTDGSTSRGAFTIAVNAINDAVIGKISDMDAQPDSVDETAPVGTPVGITAFARDGDANDTVSYSLAGRDRSFAIDPVSGVVTVNDRLDHETAPNPVVEIVARSTDGSTSTASFVVAVSDVNEFEVGHVSNVDRNGGWLDETAPIGTLAGITAFAEDPDTADTVTYQLADDAGGLFAIDPVSGVVTVAGSLDFETALQGYTIIVTASSSDGSVTQYPSRQDIRLRDVNEFDVTEPVDTDPNVNEVQEKAPRGTPVGITAKASDADGAKNRISYVILDDSGRDLSSAGGPFSIDSDGVVTTTDLSMLDVDGKITGTFLRVIAYSEDGSESESRFEIGVGYAPKWWENPAGPRVEADFPTVSEPDRQACVMADENWKNQATFNNEYAYFDCLQAAIPPIVFWRDDPKDPRGDDLAIYDGIPHDDYGACRNANDNEASQTFNNETAYYDCLDSVLERVKPSSGMGGGLVAGINACAAEHQVYFEAPVDADAQMTVTNTGLADLSVYAVTAPGTADFAATPAVVVMPGQSAEFIAKRQEGFAVMGQGDVCVGAIKAWESRNSASFAQSEDTLAGADADFGVQGEPKSSDGTPDARAGKDYSSVPADANAACGAAWPNSPQDDKGYYDCMDVALAQGDAGSAIAPTPGGDAPSGPDPRASKDYSVVSAEANEACGAAWPNSPQDDKGYYDCMDAALDTGGNQQGEGGGNGIDLNPGGAYSELPQDVLQTCQGDISCLDAARSQASRADAQGIDYRISNEYPDLTQDEIRGCDDTEYGSDGFFACLGQAQAAKLSAADDQTPANDNQPSGDGQEPGWDRATVFYQPAYDYCLGERGLELDSAAYSECYYAYPNY